jgi:hypothetical protein
VSATASATVDVHVCTLVDSSGTPQDSLGTDAATNGARAAVSEP